PDPVAGIPTETIAPRSAPAREEPRAGVEPEPAIEAVLLSFGVVRTAARTEALVAAVHVQPAQLSALASAGEPSAGVAASPPPAQNFASAGSGAPQLLHATTAGAALTGRPQFPQKCDPAA